MWEVPVNAQLKTDFPGISACLWCSGVSPALAAAAAGSVGLKEAEPRWRAAEMLFKASSWARWHGYNKWRIEHR